MFYDKNKTLSILSILESREKEMFLQLLTKTFLINIKIVLHKTKNFNV